MALKTARLRRRSSWSNCCESMWCLRMQRDWSYRRRSFSFCSPRQSYWILSRYIHVFRLGLDTGNDVVARIPFRSAGPRSLLTRSEVATMDFVRSRIGAPAPKVLAWDASSDNNVGCEYIIMDKCEGDMLVNVSDTSSYSCHYIFDIANLLSGLGGIPFSQYGSIYYKESVTSSKAPLRWRATTWRLLGAISRRVQRRATLFFFF